LSSGGVAHIFSCSKYIYIIPNGKIKEIQAFDRGVVSRILVAEGQLDERRAEWASSREIIKQLLNTLPLIEQRLRAYERLYEQGLVGMNEYLALKEERFRQFHGLEAEKSRSIQLAAAIQAVERQLEAQRAQSLAELLNERDDLRRQEEAIWQELAKVRDLSSKRKELALCLKRI